MYFSNNILKLFMQAIALIFILTGCPKGYNLEVKNNSDTPIEITTYKPIDEIYQFSINHTKKSVSFYINYTKVTTCGGLDFKYEIQNGFITFLYRNLPIPEGYHCISMIRYDNKKITLQLSNHDYQNLISNKIKIQSLVTYNKEPKSTVSLRYDLQTLEVKKENLKYFLYATLVHECESSSIILSEKVLLEENLPVEGYAIYNKESLSIGIARLFPEPYMITMDCVTKRENVKIQVDERVYQLLNN